MCENTLCAPVVLNDNVLQLYVDISFFSSSKIILTNQMRNTPLFQFIIANYKVPIKHYFAKDN